MFSPITHRTLKVRLLFATLYLLLSVFGVTMIIPFLLMFSGAVEPSLKQKNALLPYYLFSKQKLWERYLEVRNDGAFVNRKGIPPLPDQNDAEIASWREFLTETKPGPLYFRLDFLRGSRMPSYTGRQYRIWLVNQFHNDLGKLNQALGTQYQSDMSISPPYIELAGNALTITPMIAKYFEFLAAQPETRVSAFSAGDKFRNDFLPKSLGSIQEYNAKYGTAYANYSESPFTSTVPAIGREEWFTFVSQMLRPDFIDLTTDALERQRQLNVTKLEFIRRHAKPEDLRVSTLDMQFAQWASARGVSDARVPLAKLYRCHFEEEQNFWKKQFLILNFQRVSDEMLLHGRAFWNTLILVVCYVAGVLTVNPLAAYALSRFKLRQTYTLLLFCIVTMAFPAEVTMIPVFVQLKNFGLLNTYGALIIPTLANGLSIFMLKGFFDSLPKELYEAAEIDGAGEFRMFWIIAMNLSKPILAVQALGAFTAAYGAFMYALILVTDPSMWTIMVYLYQLQMASDPPVMYAALILTGTLTLAVFVACQRVIMRGIVVPSDK